MPNTRGMKRTRQQKRSRTASQSPKQEKGSGGAEIKEDIPTISRGDISNCARKQYRKSEDEAKKDEKIVAQCENVKLGGERTKPKENDGTGTMDGHNDRGTEKEKWCEEGEENGTCSSSSVSKRIYRTRRTCQSYLQQTRSHRRLVAKARTERLKREKEEEYDRAQVRLLDGMAAEERQKTMENLESERREREAVRRREVKRVKNRESVEKSRVRDLVFEAKVGCEWDELQRENECMRKVVEWFKRDDVGKIVRKEVCGVCGKRKRRLEV